MNIHPATFAIIKDVLGLLRSSCADDTPILDDHRIIASIPSPDGMHDVFRDIDTAWALLYQVQYAELQICILQNFPIRSHVSLSLRDNLAVKLNLAISSTLYIV
jgi:hypothetical protein